jgi:Double zinc ribbon domain
MSGPLLVVCGRYGCFTRIAVVAQAISRILRDRNNCLLVEPLALFQGMAPKGVHIHRASVDCLVLSWRSEPRVRRPIYTWMMLRADFWVPAPFWTRANPHPLSCINPARTISRAIPRHWRGRRCCSESVSHFTSLANHPRARMPIRSGFGKVPAATMRLIVLFFTPVIRSTSGIRNIVSSAGSGVASAWPSAQCHHGRWPCPRVIMDHDALCPACWRRIDFVRPPLCDRLGVPLKFNTGAPMLSAAAVAEPPDYDRARAVARFDGLMRVLIHGFKFHDSHNARRLFGRWIADAGSELLSDADLLVPVPLARWRLLSRRFNQAGLTKRRSWRRKPDGGPASRSILSRW